jgi:hypothetical protein
MTKPTQEQVIAWAREARFYESEIFDDIEWFTVLVTLAYEAGRKDEREGNHCGDPDCDVCL